VELEKARKLPERETMRSTIWSIYFERERHSQTVAIDIQEITRMWWSASRGNKARDASETPSAAYAAVTMKRPRNSQAAGISLIIADVISVFQQWLLQTAQTVRPA
jgi:hypothetical protein